MGTAVKLRQSLLRRHLRSHLTTSASVQPFYIISVSRRNRVRMDGFWSTACKGMPFYRSTP